MTIRTTIGATLLAGLMMLATPATAERAVVTACNHLEDGARFLPGLRITHAGTTHYVKLGEDGLTRSIIYNRQAAIRWVRAWLHDAEIYIEYGRNCGIDKPPPLRPLPAPPPSPPPAPPTPTPPSDPTPPDPPDDEYEEDMPV